MMIEKAPHLTSLLVLLHKHNPYSLCESHLAPTHTDGVDLVITELTHPPKYIQQNQQRFGSYFSGVNDDFWFCDRKVEGVTVETPRLLPPTPGIYHKWFIQPMAHVIECRGCGR